MSEEPGEYDAGLTLVPIEEKTVDFYGDSVLAALVDVAGQEQVYVPLRPICEHLGLSWAGQRERILRDVVLSEAVKGVRVTRTPSSSGRGGGAQEMLCLPLQYLPGWLFGVNASRVKEGLRDKVILYQRECFMVLWRAFQGEPAAAPGSDLAALREIARVGRAVADLADQQIAYQMRTSSRLDRAAEVVRTLDRRLSTVERRISGGEFVTEEQAAEISARVKALAEYLSSREPGKVHYQSIFGEVYRRWGVSSYKSIPMAKYGDVLQFLEDWRRAAETHEPTR